MRNNMATLPKEIEDTIYDETVFLSQDGYAGGWVEMKRQDIREICLKVYTTARRQALTEAIASLPIKNHVDEGDNVTHAKDEYWGCCECYTDDYMNKYRTEAIAKLTQLRDV